MSGDGTQVGETEFSIDPTPPRSPTWNRDSENTPVYAVVSAVAEATGADPFELPPLNEAVDPDALNALFASRPTTAENLVSFQYAGFEVVVCGDGEIHLEPESES